MAELRRKPQSAPRRPKKLDSSRVEDWLTDAEIAARTEKALAYNDYMSKHGQGRDPDVVVAGELQGAVLGEQIRAEVEWRIAYRAATGVEYDPWVEWKKKKPPKK